MATLSTPRVPSTADLSTWLTRNEICDLLDVSYPTVLDWEKKGLIKPQFRARTGNGRQVIVVYDPTQLTKIPRRHRNTSPDNPDECAARAFELFDEGVPMRECVVRLRRRLEVIEALHKEWLDAGGTDFVLNPAARAELGRYVGDFSDVSELVTRVREKLGATIEATVPDDATDAEIEVAIVRVLDEAHGGES